MEDLVSATLALVFVAMFIAFRLLSSRRKKAETADRLRFAKEVATATRLEKLEKQEKVFDAFALVPDEDESPVQAVVTGTSAKPVGSESWRIQSTHQSKTAARTAQVPASPLGARLDRLTSLQRAVVLAEVLGQPKGLRDR